MPNIEMLTNVAVMRFTWVGDGDVTTTDVHGPVVVEKFPDREVFTLPNGNKVVIKDTWDFVHVIKNQL
jgi:hypothetical protein